MHSQQPHRKPRFYNVFFGSQETCRESEAPSHGPKTLPGPRLRWGGGWGGVCGGTPAPTLPWGGIRPRWVIKAFTSLKCLVLTLIPLIWDLSVISRAGNLLLGKRENPLRNMSTQVCSDKRPSAVCLLSNPNIRDRINVGFTYTAK